jgi:hypothetical protein
MIQPTTLVVSGATSGIRFDGMRGSWCIRFADHGPRLRGQHWNPKNQPAAASRVAFWSARDSKARTEDHANAARPRCSPTESTTRARPAGSNDVPEYGADDAEKRNLVCRLPWRNNGPTFSGRAGSGPIASIVATPRAPRQSNCPEEGPAGVALIWPLLGTLPHSGHRPGVARGS